MTDKACASQDCERPATAGPYCAACYLVSRQAAAERKQRRGHDPLCRDCRGLFAAEAPEPR